MERIKPDIVAPGVNIIGSYPNDTYAMLTGSAAATANTAGATALFYQYTIVDANYKGKGFTQEVRTFMRAGATRSVDISYPNTSLGYGVLNLRGMFDALK